MTNSDSRVAVYTGSFDPITLGHLNVIERCSRLVDRLIVGIGINLEKQSLFTPDEREELVRLSTAGLGNVEVRSFTGLAVHFVRACGARVMLRGVRSLGDIEAEFTMTLANRKLDPGIETVFLMADDQYSHISSSLIKQIAPLAGDEELARFVPRDVVTAVRRKMGADPAGADGAIRHERAGEVTEGNSSRDEKRRPKPRPPGESSKIRPRKDR